MVHLFKREFYNTEWLIYFMFFFIPLIYVFDMSIIYPVTFTLIFIILSNFHTDEKFHVNRTMRSIPVKKQTTVKVRYIFLTIALVITILYQSLIDKLAHYGLPYLESESLNSILLFMLISIILAISL